MQYTENYLYKKPEYGEKAKVDDINYNSDLSDNLMKNTRDMLAEYFSQTKAYVAGNFVQREGKFYKFIADKAAGNWDATKVEQTNLADELGDSMPPITEEAEGNPITFDNGASAPLAKCTAEIVASQDLHGYDKPWVGGAGKNILPLVLADIKSANTSGTWSGNAYTVNGVTFTVNTDNDGNAIGIKVTGTATNNVFLTLSSFTLDITSYILNGCPNSGSDTTYFLYVQNTDGTYKDYGNAVNVPISSAISTTATIAVRNGYSCPTNGLIFYPMLRLSTVSDATFEPYSNICPISGYDEVEIEGCGKNLVDNSTFVLKPFNADTSNNTRARMTHAIKMPIGTPITISVDSAFLSTYVYAIYTLTSDYPAQTTHQDSGWVNVSNSHLTTENEYVGFSVRRIDPGNIDLDHIKSMKIQIEAGSQATAFEPYNPDSKTYTISLGSTRYGGELDVSRGVLRVTHGYVDLGDLSWTYISDSTDLRWKSNSISGIAVPQPSVAPSAIAEEYETVALTTQNANTSLSNLAIYQSKIFCRNLSDTIEPNGLCVYELATPLEISLTPTQVRSLLGSNYLSCNSGDLAIEYYTQDWQKIIDLIEKESGGGSEKHNYSTDEQIVGTWIDGSDVYEKSYTGTVSDNSNHLIDSSLLFPNVRLVGEQTMNCWSAGYGADFGGIGNSILAPRVYISTAGVCYGVANYTSTFGTITWNITIRYVKL